MRKKVIILLFVMIFSVSSSYAKYKLSDSIKVFHISQLEEPEVPVFQATISGKILTENINGKHKSLITIYKTNDTRDENDATNPRQIIQQVTTNEDGTFSATVIELEKYDVVVSKDGYLDYRVVQIEVAENQDTALDEYKLIPGEFIKDGIISLEDMDDLRIHYEAEINEMTEKYDLNGDGVISLEDMDILNDNFEKMTETIVWQN